MKERVNGSMRSRKFLHLLINLYLYIFCSVCMVHDLAESIVGDITPHCNVSKEEKRQLEEVQPQNNSVA